MNPVRKVLRRLLPATAMWLLLHCPLAGATGGAAKSFQIAADDASSSLRAFSAQSGEQIVYPVQAVRGVRTNRVQGTLTPRDALEVMVHGTELRVVQDAQTGALAIVRERSPTVARPKKLPFVAPRVAVISPNSEDELVRLNPFEVRSDPDNSYQALDTNTLTSFRIALNKMPATSVVFTRTFMDDVAATSIQDVLANYAGTVGPDPNNTGAALAMPADRDSVVSLGIRGLTASAPKRDGFIGMNSLFRSSIGYTDNFSIERVEVIEGPQSLLYGAVGGGGVINAVSKRAYFDVSRGQMQTRVDQYGSKRVVADYNQGGSHLAMRIAAVAEEKRNVRYNLGGDLYGLYAQAAVRIGPTATLRVFGERDSSWGNVPFTPNATDLNNFLPLTDPRRGQDVRYLALTGQLTGLRGTLWNGPVDYEHISSLSGWWSSERIDAKFAGMTFETVLGRGFSMQAGVIYSETTDDRFTGSKNLVPGQGLSGAGANPFRGTAVRFTPGDNWQSDRTRGIRLSLLHEAKVRIAGIEGRAQTVIGVQGSHQGPAFASSGIDRLYYLADANWNPVTASGSALDYGRVAIGNLYIPVQGGLPLRPVFRPGARRITLNGQNYVLEPRIVQRDDYVTPQNPSGLVPNNPTAANPNGYVGGWNRGGETHDRQWYLANFTEWAGGKVTTVAGVSLDRFETMNVNPGVSPTYLAPRDYPGFQVGATYRLDAIAGARLYTAVGTAGLAAGTTKDLYGDNLRVPRTASAWPEVGIKYESPNGRWNGQLVWVPQTKVVNETQRAGLDFLNAINPRGINGRFNGGDQWINVDRQASTLEINVTATPTPNWRLRLNAAKLGGEITSTVVYRQLYNDQFHASAGRVTYRDGTPLLVDPNGTNAASSAPLTLAMINDPADPYYAAPDPDSGRITNALLIAALSAVDPQHGSAATGVTGLPLSAIQYAFNNPHRGEITVVSAGDKTTGVNEYSFNFQSNYTFRDGALRGWGVFADVRTYWRNRAYYTSYFPNGATGATFQATRVLYRLPSATICGLGLNYRLKLTGWFSRIAWTTRLNIENVFENSRVWVVPNPANGANLNARLSAQPRTFIWSNSVTF